MTQVLFQKSTRKIILLAIVVISCLPKNSVGQTSVYEIFDTLKSLRTNLLSIPNRDDTLTVGIINVDDVINNFLPDCLEFQTATYDGPNVRYANPDVAGGILDGNKILYTKSKGGIIVYPNKLHLNVRFKIINWKLAPNSAITITLGSQQKRLTETEKKDEIVFRNVTDDNPKLSIGFGNIKMISASRNKQINIGSLSLPGLLPFKIDTKKIDMGAFQIPAVPITIVYAPPVDAAKLNTAKLSNSTNRGIQTTISFTTQKSKTVPSTSTYWQTQETQEGLNTMSAIMSKIPNPIIQAIAEGMKFVSEGLGSTTPTETITRSTTNEQSFKISYTHTEDDEVKASIGGPGVGDQFIYLLNPKFLWVKNHDKLYLTLIGKTEKVSVSAQQLVRGFKRLERMPAGTKDDTLQLDKNTISELLKLDPFVAGGPYIIPQADRFKPVDNIIYNVGAQSISQTFTTQVSTDTKNVSTITHMNTETDKKGVLSSIGLGIDEDKVIQTVITQSNIVQNSSSESFSNSFKFNGNGHEYYSVEVYFDAVFGAFAFRQVKPATDHIISGKLVSHQPLGDSLPNITMNTGSETYITQPDTEGNFVFPLPKSQTTYIKLSSGNASIKVKFSGKPLQNILLK